VNISQLKLRSEEFNNDDDDDDDDDNNIFFCFCFCAFIFPVYLSFIAFIGSCVCNPVS
jgi:hypothetical protein